jgi:hypothetical protein
MRLFSNNTHLNNDRNYVNYKDSLNKKSNHYLLNNFTSSDQFHKAKQLGLQFPNYQVKNGNGWISNDNLQIDVDSKIRNSDTLTNKNNIHQFKQPDRISVLAQYTKPKLKIEIENQLRPSLRKNCQRQVDTLKDYDFTQNTFHPQLEKNPKNQNSRYIIQEDVRADWTRGGNMTRDIIHCPKYLKKIGYSYNGKFWHK